MNNHQYQKFNSYKQAKKTLKKLFGDGFIETMIIYKVKKYTRDRVIRKLAKSKDRFGYNQITLFIF